MEGLAPPLELAITVRASMECGDSVRLGINKYIKKSQSEFAHTVSRWLFIVDQGGSVQPLYESLNSQYRVALLRTLESGLKGQAIIHILKEIETELSIAADQELQRFISLLPVKLLVPLVIFQLPSYFIMLLGPIVRRLFGEV